MPKAGFRLLIGRASALETGDIRTGRTGWTEFSDVMRPAVVSESTFHLRCEPGEKNSSFSRKNRSQTRSSAAWEEEEAAIVLMKLSGEEEPTLSCQGTSGEKQLALVCRRVKCDGLCWHLSAFWCAQIKDSLIIPSFPHSAVRHCEPPHPTLPHTHTHTHQPSGPPALVFHVVSLP